MMNANVIEVKFGNLNLFLDNFDNTLATRWTLIWPTHWFDNYLSTSLIPLLGHEMPLPPSSGSCGDDSGSTDGNHTDTHRVVVRICVKGKNEVCPGVFEVHTAGPRGSSPGIEGWVKVNARAGETE